MSDEPEVTPPAEEVTPEPEAPEAEPETPEEPEAPETPAPDDAEKRFKDQQGRAVKAEGQRDTYKQRLIDAGLDPETGKPKESGQAPKKDGQDLSKLEQRVIASELRSAGHTHPDDQKFILDAARRLGIEPLEAAADEFVAQKLEKMREARKTKENTPAPGKGSGGSQRKVKNAWDMTDAEFEKERARVMQGK